VVPAHIDPIIGEDGSIQPILFDKPWILLDAQGKRRRWTEHGEDLTNVLFADGHVEARHPMAKP
jgi:prepilin-type processing-associated H-X9-DG protein